MSQPTSSAAIWPRFKRFLPLIILVFALIAFFASGLHRQLSFDTVALHFGALSAFIESHAVISALTAVLVYAVATALSFPIALLLTVTTGLLFGWMVGTVIVMFGATLGASVLYFAARYALADFFRARAGNALNKMAEGFREDAVSYMLFLRLAAIFPFFLVNVVPAILAVPFRIFVWTTFVGITPGVIAYAFAGEGLRSIVAERAAACTANQTPCGQELSAGDLVTKEILIAFALLAIVSLIPVVLKRLRRKSVT